MSVINADIAELEAFLAVADAKSFRQAADRLNISQPAVSNRIRRLERKVDLRLLDRTTRSVELTESGKRFKVKAAAAVQGVVGLVDEFRDEAAMKHGRVALMVSASLAAVVLPTVLVEFHRRYPQIRVDLVETFESVSEVFQAADADFAFVSDSIVRPGIRFEQLLTEDFVLFAPRGHPLESRSAVEMTDIAQYPILLPTNSALGAVVSDLFASKNLQSNVVLQSHNLLTLLSMVQTGVGTIVLPRLLSTCVDLNLVAMLKITDGPSARRFGLAFRRGRSLSVAARALVRAIQRHYQP